MIAAKAISFRTDNEDIGSCGQFLPFILNSQQKGSSSEEIHRIEFE